MLKRSIAFLTCLMLLFPSSGYSWGNKGHQTVGRIAQLFLQDDNAQTTLDKIQAILKPGESLASIAPGLIRKVRPFRTRCSGFR